MSYFQFNVCSCDLYKLNNQNYDEGQMSPNEEALLGKADIYLFQGVGKVDHSALIQSLRQRKFEIIHVRGHMKPSGAMPIDTVIAFDSQKFLRTHNGSDEVLAFNTDYRRDFAVAELADKRTGQLIALVSASVPPPNPEKDEALDPEKDETSVGKVGEEAQNYNSHIMRKLSNSRMSSNCRVQIIGSLMNALPVDNADGYNVFFENGFQLSNLPQANGTDFIFNKIVTPLFSGITSIFCKTIENRVELNRSQNLEAVSSQGENEKQIPLFVTVSSRVKNSKLVEFFNAIFNFLKSVFKQAYCLKR